MRLTRYLRDDLVLTDLSGSDASAVIDALSDHLGDHLSEIDRDELRDALLDREERHTTALGRGIAIPHATVGGLETPVVAVAIAPAEIQFGPPGTDPVGLFFVLVSPPGRERDHIQLLARICRLVREPGFVEGLVQAGSATEIVRAIGEVDERHGGERHDGERSDGGGLDRSDAPTRRRPR